MVFVAKMESGIGAAVINLAMDTSYRPQPSGSIDLFHGAVKLNFESIKPIFLINRYIYACMFIDSLKVFMIDCIHDFITLASSS